MTPFETTKEIKKTCPFLSLAFRPMFLMASLFSIIALTLWGLSFTGIEMIEPYGGWLYWHAHEMTFGFVAAVLVGFLLTAVQSWTGLRSLHGVELAFLLFLWILARLLMLFGQLLPFWSVMIVDMSFTLLAGFKLYHLLSQKKQTRNYFAVVALILLSICNGVSHFSIQRIISLNFIDIINATLLIITMVMIIIGGRVIPMFTANATQTPPKARLIWLETAVMANVWILIAIFILKIFTNTESQFIAIPFVSCALLLTYLAMRWRFITTIRIPLLWSLQLSYWLIPIGLFLVGLHFLNLFNLSLSIHTLTVGAMAGMILSMMSRVSLGHTGRPIKADKLMALSFLAALCAVIVRVVFVFAWPDQKLTFLWLSISCWVVAYGIFVFKYYGYLTSARADGKEA